MPCCTGLNGCNELRQLHISGCGLADLPRCKVLRQVTELRLHTSDIGWPILDFVAAAMPQLVTLDMSHKYTHYTRQGLVALSGARHCHLVECLQSYVCA